MVNVGLNTRSLHGSQLEFEGRAGSRWHLLGHYSIANPFLVKLNVDVKFGGTSAEMLREGTMYSGNYFRTLQSLYVIVLTGVFTDLVPVEVLTSFIPAHELARLQTDPFVTSLFGGIVFGFGMALCLRWNATTGGTDFIAIYLSEKKGRETWNLILALNAAILLCGGCKFGWTGALYSIVYQFITLQVVHLMYRTYQYQTLLIVTTRPKEICEAIYRFSHHGATILDAKGSYKGEAKSLVMSVVAADDTTHIYALCKKLDPAAFIDTISTSRVIGRFYLRPRD